jgi:hypothetical protein
MFPMIFVPSVIVFMLVIVFFVQRFVRVGGKTYKTLAVFMEAFSEETGFRPEAVHATYMARLRDARFTGEARGRRVEVVFWGEKNPQAFLHVAAERAPQFSVSLEGLTAQLSKAIGLKKDIDTGDQAFDERYVVESNEPGRAREALASPALREAIASVFAHFEPLKLESMKGQLSVSFAADKFRAGDVTRLAARLAEVAELLDPVHVHASAATFDHARCGYCHEDLTHEAMDLVACEVCQTVMHKGCHAELGRCAVAGCAGKAPVKAHVRA